MRFCIIVAVLIVAAPMLAFAYSTGAGTCDVNGVSGPHGSTAQSTNGGFQLGAKPNGNGKFGITLSGKGKFEGMLLYIVDDSGNRLGTFSNVPSGLKLKDDCDDGGSSNPVTHSSKDLKSAGFSVDWDAGKTSGQVTATGIVLTGITNWYKLDDLKFDLASTQAVGNVNSVNTGGSVTATDDRNAIVAFFQDYTLFAIVLGISLVLYIAGAILELVLKKQRAQAKGSAKKAVAL